MSSPSPFPGQLGLTGLPPLSTSTPSTQHAPHTREQQVETLKEPVTSEDYDLFLLQMGEAFEQAGMTLPPDPQASSLATSPLDMGFEPNISLPLAPNTIGVQSPASTQTLSAQPSQLPTYPEAPEALLQQPQGPPVHPFGSTQSLPVTQSATPTPNDFSSAPTSSTAAPAVTPADLSTSPQVPVVQPEAETPGSPKNWWAGSLGVGSRLGGWKSPSTSASIPSPGPSTPLSLSPAALPVPLPTEGKETVELSKRTSREAELPEPASKVARLDTSAAITQPGPHAPTQTPSLTPQVRQVHPPAVDYAAAMTMAEERLWGTRPPAVSTPPQVSTPRMGNTIHPLARQPAYPSNPAVGQVQQGISPIPVHQAHAGQSTPQAYPTVRLQPPTPIQSLDPKTRMQPSPNLQPGNLAQQGHGLHSQQVMAAPSSWGQGTHAQPQMPPTQAYQPPPPAWPQQIVGPSGQQRHPPAQPQLKQTAVLNHVQQQKVVHPQHTPAYQLTPMGKTSEAALLMQNLEAGKRQQEEWNREQAARKREQIKRQHQSLGRASIAQPHHILASTPSPQASYAGPQPRPQAVQPPVAQATQQSQPLPMPSARGHTGPPMGAGVPRPAVQQPPNIQHRGTAREVLPPLSDPRRFNSRAELEQAMGVRSSPAASTPPPSTSGAQDYPSVALQREIPRPASNVPAEEPDSEDSEDEVNWFELPPVPNFTARGYTAAQWNQAMRRKPEDEALEMGALRKRMQEQLGRVEAASKNVSRRPAQPPKPKPQPKAATRAPAKPTKQASRTSKPYERPESSTPGSSVPHAPSAVPVAPGTSHSQPRHAQQVIPPTPRAVATPVATPPIPNTIRPQGYSPQGYPQQGYPPQGLPQNGYPNHLYGPQAHTHQATQPRVSYAPQASMPQLSYSPQAGTPQVSTPHPPQVRLPHPSSPYPIPTLAPRAPAPQASSPPQYIPAAQVTVQRPQPFPHHQLAPAPQVYHVHAPSPRRYNASPTPQTSTAPTPGTSAYQTPPQPEVNQVSVTLEPSAIAASPSQHGLPLVQEEQMLMESFDLNLNWAEFEEYLRQEAEGPAHPPAVDSEAENSFAQNGEVFDIAGLEFSNQEPAPPASVPAPVVEAEAEGAVAQDEQSFDLKDFIAFSADFSADDVNAPPPPAVIGTEAGALLEPLPVRPEHIAWIDDDDDGVSPLSAEQFVLNVFQRRPAGVPGTAVVDDSISDTTGEAAAAPHFSRVDTSAWTLEQWMAKHAALTLEVQSGTNLLQQGA